MRTLRLMVLLTLLGVFLYALRGHHLRMSLAEAVPPGDVTRARALIAAGADPDGPMDFGPYV